MAWSLIGASCSYSVAIRRLVLSGLDSSARSILRAIDEHLITCIVFLHDYGLADRFFEAQNFEDANKFWYKELRTKAFENHLNLIEKKFGIDLYGSKELREWRQEEIKLQSQSLHPSYVISALASNSICASGPNILQFSALGCASMTSERTLEYACKTIWYFSRFGFVFLFEKNNKELPLIEFKKDDEML